jgi:hypothetical protein
MVRYRAAATPCAPRDDHSRSEPALRTISVRDNRKIRPASAQGCRRNRRPSDCGRARDNELKLSRDDLRDTNGVLLKGILSTPERTLRLGTLRCSAHESGHPACFIIATASFATLQPAGHEIRSRRNLRQQRKSNPRGYAMQKRNAPTEVFRPRNLLRISPTSLYSQACIPGFHLRERPMELFLAEMVAVLKSETNKTCPSCSKRLELVRTMVDSRTGCIVHMFECPCGQRIWID